MMLSSSCLIFLAAILSVTSLGAASPPTNLTTQMKAPNPQPNSDSSHPLDSVAGVSAEAVRALKSRWIETAEAALAATATPEGRDGLRELLAMDAPSFQAFMDALVRAVGSERATQLRKPMPGGARGVVLTEEQKKRMGITGSDPKPTGPSRP